MCTAPQYWPNWARFSAFAGSCKKKCLKNTTPTTLCLTCVVTVVNQLLEWIVYKPRLPREAAMEIHLWQKGHVSKWSWMFDCTQVTRIIRVAQLKLATLFAGPVMFAALTWRDDVHSRCPLAMSTRDVHSRCPLAMSTRDVHSRCPLATEANGRWTRLVVVVSMAVFWMSPIVS